MRGRTSAKNTVKCLGKFVSMSRAKSLIREVRFLGNIRFTEHAQQRVPKLVRHAHHVNPTIGSPKGLYWGDREMCAARQTRRCITSVQIPSACIAKLV